MLRAIASEPTQSQTSDPHAWHSHRLDRVTSELITIWQHVDLLTTARVDGGRYGLVESVSGPRYVSEVMELWVDGRFVPLPPNINTVQVRSVSSRCSFPPRAHCPLQ
jgi:hypothetical protein